MPRNDDDDRPRRRRHRDDDEDDRPRRRSRRDDDDDDRPRARRKSRRETDEEDYDDRPRRKSRPKTKELNVVGLVGLLIAIPSLFLSFIPCMGWYAIIPALVGMIVGLVGLTISQKSDGRYGPGLPFAAMGVGAAAILIALAWLLLIRGLEKAGEKMMADFEAEAAKAEAEHKAEMEKAAKEVQAAGAQGAIRVSAAQFYKAYDDDDEDRADQLYKNKVIEVVGTIHEVSFTGEVYTVMLKGGGGEFETVDCHFAKDPAVRERLAQLRPGQTVTIRGKCMGGISDLEACVLVQ
jgi:hypothetical protein